MRFSLSFFACIAITSLAHGSAPPVAFEPNRGQAEADVRFAANGNRYRLALLDRGARLTLRNAQGVASIDVEWAGSRRSATWEGLGLLSSYSSHFRGQDPSKWVTGVPNFERVRESGVYPGVDLVYYSHNGALEYDFVIAPHARPDAIRMNFGRAGGLHLDREGNLILETAAGPLVQRKPVAYQMVRGVRREVESRFRMANRSVTFDLGAYDSNFELTVDPSLQYSSFLGGTGSDHGNSVAADSSGNLYMTGVTFSTSGGDGDVLFRKFSPTGAQVFQMDFGGSRDDYGNGIAVDAAGTVYIGGRTNSNDFPVQNAFQKGRAGGYDGFLLRATADGKSLYFSTYVGGSSDDFGYAVAIDPQGGAYLTGSSVSSDFPTSQNSYQSQNRGGIDAFVFKTDLNGNAIYSTLIGGGSDDNAYGIAVDGGGNAYIAGSTNSDSFPQVNNPYQHSRHGGLDAFAVELNPAGSNLVYSSFLGGANDEVGNGIAVDATGSAFIVGTTASTDYPTTNGAYNTSYNGGSSDIFITKLTPGQANLAYSTYLGSHGADEGYSIAVDGAGVAYIAGYSDSDQYPVTSFAVQTTRGGGDDVVFTKMNTAGNTLIYSTFLGGSQDDIAYGIAIDPATNVYLTGITSSSNFPVTPGAFQPTPGGGDSDAFFAVISFANSGGAPVISTGGIVNGANFASGPVAPGSVISIFGSNFIGSAVSATTVPLPTNLGGVQVLVNGSAAPLFYAGQMQINAQLPYGIPVGSASIQVTGPGGSSSSASFSVAQAAPALLTSNGRAIVVNADGTVNAPGRPARVGSTVVAYFTGIGPVNANVTTGAGSPQATSTLPYQLTVGGVTAQTTYVGLSPGGIGLAQANFQVPNVGTADQQLVLTIGGVSSASALINVSQ